MSIFHRAARGGVNNQQWHLDSTVEVHERVITGEAAEFCLSDPVPGFWCLVICTCNERRFPSWCPPGETGPRGRAWLWPSQSHASTHPVESKRAELLTVSWRWVSLHANKKERVCLTGRLTGIKRKKDVIQCSMKSTERQLELILTLCFTTQ